MPDHCEHLCGPFVNCTGASFVQASKGRSGPFLRSEWAYDSSGTTNKVMVSTNTVSNYENQVASICFAKLHQPKWRERMLPCLNNGSMQTSIQNYYRENTEAVNFSWVPAVYINGTFSMEASHNGDLLSYLD
jgi:hypothetical protein